MPPADLDDLFGEGAELGRDVVVKAQLRFRVHPPRHLAAQDVVDRVVAAYDERLDMIVDEVSDVLRHADPRRSGDQPLVLVPDAGPVAKAVTQPFRPGSRGGKWYRDARGNVRYGDPPEGRFMGNAAAAPAPAGDNMMPFHPGPFMGELGNDQALTGFLLEHGGALGFTEGELRFLGAWYGADGEGGALFDAFLECAQLTRDDLKSGVANFRFGSQQLTYEEAVFEFFAAQESLFMGGESHASPAPTTTNPAASTTTDQDKEWQRVLHDEIKPLLTGVFAKYEGAKDDEDVQRRFAAEPERQRRRFLDHARRHADDVDGIADDVVGDWKPDRQVDAAVAGLQAIGLFARRARAERHAYVHGRPHLRDAVAMDGRLLGDGPGNPLLASTDGLATLSPSQLMLLYAAAELHRRWDPHSKSFSTEAQAEVGSGELGEAALAALAGKTSRWAEASGMVRDRLEELVDRLVVKLNAVNAREGLPAKHGPAKSPRSKR